MRNTFHRLLLVIVLVAFAGQVRAAITLADLLQGGTITSGDKVFYGFENFSETGDLVVGPANIAVIPIFSGGEYGIRFQTGLWQLVGANKSYDIAFDFNVRRLDRLPYIHDNTLVITGGQANGGNATIAEGVVDPTNGNTLANKLVIINPNVQILVDHKIFAYDVAVALIRKDFAMTTGANANALIFVSHFDQTFSQVPEPGVLTIMSLASLGLLRRSRKS